jgi:hypothetical protein
MGIDWPRTGTGTIALAPGMRAKYSLAEQGYHVQVRCRCGSVAVTFIRDLDRWPGPGRPPSVDGWEFGGDGPRCPGCVAAACDRIADELLLSKA